MGQSTDTAGSEQLRTDLKQVTARANRDSADLAQVQAERDALKKSVQDAGEVLRLARRIMACSSHDWSAHPDDAWLYGLLVGWDCELPEHANGEHDPIDCSGPQNLERFAERFGWTEGGVAKLRAQRRTIAALSADNQD